MKRRTKLEIYHAILKNAVNGVLRTPLMQASRVNWCQLTRYLKELNDKGLLTVRLEHAHVKVKTTSKGLEFLHFMKQFERNI